METLSDFLGSSYDAFVLSFIEKLTFLSYLHLCPNPTLLLYLNFMMRDTWVLLFSLPELGCCAERFSYEMKLWTLDYTDAPCWKLTYGLKLAPGYIFFFFFPEEKQLLPPWLWITMLSWRSNLGHTFCFALAGDALSLPTRTEASMDFKERGHWSVTNIS